MYKGNEHEDGEMPQSLEAEDAVEEDGSIGFAKPLVIKMKEDRPSIVLCAEKGSEF